MSSTLSFESDDFLIANAHEVLLETKKVATSTTQDLKRGTLLANDGDGTYSIATSSTIGDAEVILAKDIAQVASSTDIDAPVYVQGCFIPEKLLTGSSTAITTAAEENLKKNNINLIHGVEV